MAQKVGDRVGAMLSCRDGVAHFFGYGVYEGDFVPEEAIGWLADTAREAKITNPRIRLDTGKTVYGCECWWGGETNIQATLAEQVQVIEVDIDGYREHYREREAERAQAAKQNGAPVGATGSVAASDDGARDRTSEDQG